MVLMFLMMVQAPADLVAGDVKRCATDMKFTEGPVADGKGNVYYSDIPNNRIMKWDGKENAVWRENSGGSNGLKIDKDGNLVACEGGGRRVVRIATADQKVTVLADSYEGKKLNSPNDLCFDARGGIYFTDPRYGKRDDMELDKEAVYYIPPGGGKLLRVADDLVRPNGIHIHGDRLYVADQGGKKVYAYGMHADGILKEKREFAPVSSDGIKVDEKGNLYTTTGKGVEIFAPDGKALGVIAVPEGPANCAFDGNALYVTARKSLYRVPMKVAGN
jgi:gluconolactonase